MTAGPASGVLQEGPTPFLAVVTAHDGTMLDRNNGHVQEQRSLYRLDDEHSGNTTPPRPSECFHQRHAGRRDKDADGLLNRDGSRRCTVIMDQEEGEVDRREPTPDNQYRIMRSTHERLCRALNARTNRPSELTPWPLVFNLNGGRHVGPFRVRITVGTLLTLFTTTERLWSMRPGCSIRWPQT